MFLSDLEVIELTGYKMPSKQSEWLRGNGFDFRVARDGHPRVLRSHVEKQMGGAEAAVRKRTQPDFSSLVRA